VSPDEKGTRRPTNFRESLGLLDGGAWNFGLYCLLPLLSQPGAHRRNFPSIQALRGIAALVVCWYHFTAYNVAIPQGWVKSSGTYGYLGVEGFFVISGFIVPYSLFVAEYRLPSFLRFLYKRIARIDPPYLASILLSMAVTAIARRTPHTGADALPHYNFVQVALHLAYLIPFSEHQVWIDGVYWTLAVEFQYYLALALTFPALMSTKAAVRRLSLTAALSASLLTNNAQFLPPFIPLFLLGIAGMQFLCKLISRREFILYVGACGLTAMYTAGTKEACVGLATLACILIFRSAPTWILALGNISYSLYLIHIPIGIRAESLGRHFIPVQMILLEPVFAVFVSVACAWVFYRLIEQPAKQWASTINYRRPVASASGVRQPR
jgi:peptidoglycan/LPS O-acetylase OafA/YrhL